MRLKKLLVTLTGLLLLAGGIASADSTPAGQFFDNIIAGQACEPPRTIGVSLSDGLTYECNAQRRWTLKFSASGFTCASDPGSLHQCTVHITAAQILAMQGTPVELVAAAGAGRIIDPFRSFVVYTPGSHPFSSNALALYIGTNDTDLSIDDDLGSIMDTILAVGTPSATFGAVYRLNSGDAVPLVDLVNQPLVLGIVGDYSNDTGAIATSSVTAGGADYEAGDTGNITCDDYGLGATYVVDTVSSGAVLTYHLSATGGGYLALAPTCSTTTGGAQAGIGTGLIIRPTTVTKGNGSLDWTVVYRVIQAQ